MNPAHWRVCLGFALILGLRPEAGAQGPRTPPVTGATPSITAPALVSHVVPPYPQIAQSARVEGVVELAVRLAADGRVADVRVNRSQPLLDQAAIDALRQWRFAPSSDKSASVVVEFRFSLHEPSRYPRPAAFRQPLPSWIPENFAFVYKYECGQTAVEIDSIERTVTNARGYPRAAQRFAFSFDREQASEVFITLVGAGFFDAALDRGRDSYEEGGRSTWREAAPVESGLERETDRIISTIAAEAPVYVVNDRRVVKLTAGDLVRHGIAWRASFDVRVMTPPALRVLHTLRVRRGDRWTETRWVEPHYRHPPEHVKELAIAGHRIRALVKNNLSNVATRPRCL